MKNFALGIASVAIVALAACTSASDNTASTTNTDTAKTATIDTPKTPEFKPFDVAEIAHTVKDYSRWKIGFDEDSNARKASGLELLVIGRNTANPNDLFIVLQASDVQKAKDFAANPRLKEVMEKHGVISRPAINYFHVIRFNPNSKEKQWVIVNHKVKDFDAWVKVFDAEGTAKGTSPDLTTLPAQSQSSMTPLPPLRLDPSLRVESRRI